MILSTSGFTFASDRSFDTTGKLSIQDIIDSEIKVVELTNDEKAILLSKTDVVRSSATVKNYKKTQNLIIPVDESSFEKCYRR